MQSDPSLKIDFLLRYTAWYLNATIVFNALDFYVKLKSSFCNSVKQRRYVIYCCYYQVFMYSFVYTRNILFTNVLVLFNNH